MQMNLKEIMSTWNSCPDRIVLCEQQHYFKEIKMWNTNPNISYRWKTYIPHAGAPRMFLLRYGKFLVVLYRRYQNMYLYMLWLVIVLLKLLEVHEMPHKLMFLTFLATNSYTLEQCRTCYSKIWFQKIFIIKLEKFSYKKSSYGKLYCLHLQN